LLLKKLNLYAPYYRTQYTGLSGQALIWRCFSQQRYYQINASTGELVPVSGAEQVLGNQIFMGKQRNSLSTCLPVSLFT
jgi:hypothetical protein